MSISTPGRSAPAAGLIGTADGASLRLGDEMIPHLRGIGRNRSGSLPMRLWALTGSTFELRTDAPPSGGAFQGYAAQKDGVLLGVSCDSHDDGDRPHPWEANLLAYLTAVATGRIAAPPLAPSILKPLYVELLAHDGFSTDGVENVARILGSVTLEAGERRHILRVAHRLPGANSLIGDSLQKLEIDLGKGVSVTKHGLVVRQSLPDTIVMALPGRRADEAIGHPVLGVSARSITTGHVFVVEPM